MGQLMARLGEGALIFVAKKTGQEWGISQLRFIIMRR